MQKITRRSYTFLVALPLLLPLAPALTGAVPAHAASVRSAPGVAPGVVVDEAGRMVLPDGIKIRVEIMDDLLSNKAKEGEDIEFRVKEEVLGPGKVVLIRRGARGKGKVLAAKGARTLGRKGKLDFSIESVEAIDGSLVTLRSQQATGGKNRQGAVIAGDLIFAPILGFVKGKNVTIKRGTIFDAYVDEAVTIQPNAEGAPGAGATGGASAAAGSGQMMGLKAAADARAHRIVLKDETEMKGVITGLVNGEMIIQVDTSTVKMIPCSAISSAVLAPGTSSAPMLSISLKSGTQAVGTLESFQDGKFNIMTANGATFVQMENLVSMSLPRNELK